MKLIQQPALGATNWLFKIESEEAATAVEVGLSTSQEGHVEPVINTWQTYTFNLSDLAAAGLDLSKIDVIMMFPAWGPGNGAIFRVDNVVILEDGNAAVVTPPPAEQPVVETIYDDNANPVWAAWDCCGNTTPMIVVDDVDHGQTTEFTVVGSTVLGFTARDSDGAVGGQPFDASSLVENGYVSFDLKMTQLPTGGQSDWLIKVESEAAATAAEVSLSTSVEGHAAPALDTWQTYTFSFATLQAAGLDLSAIDVFMVFPAWGPGDGAVFRIDNFRIHGTETNVIPPVVNTQMNLDFETGGAGKDGYTWVVFENDTNPDLEFVANPAVSAVNDSATVAKFTALQTGQPFVGTETKSGPVFTLDQTNKIVRIMVYKTVISDVGIKFAVDAAAQPELKVANTKVNEWEELTFDFTSYIGRAETININTVIVFPDFNARTSDNIIYFDNITFSDN